MGEIAGFKKGFVGIFFTPNPRESVSQCKQSSFSGPPGKTDMLTLGCKVGHAAETPASPHTSCLQNTAPSYSFSHPSPACCGGQRGSAKPTGQLRPLTAMSLPSETCQSRVSCFTRHPGTLRSPLPASDSCCDLGHQPMRIPGSWERVQREDKEENTSVSTGTPGTHATK